MTMSTLHKLTKLTEKISGPSIPLYHLESALNQFIKCTFMRGITVLTATDKGALGCWQVLAVEWDGDSIRIRVLLGKCYAG